MAPTRQSVHNGVAAYFGGTFQPNFRCWQNGPLVSSGLSTVRKGWPRELNDADYTVGQAAGVGMGCFMIVELGDIEEHRQDIAGPPVVDGSNNLIAGGVKQINYRVTLHGFHMAQRDYAEDQADAIDVLLEAIYHQIRVDRTLGGICTQAGESRYGIRTRVNLPGDGKNDRSLTAFTIAFDIMTQIIG